MEVFRTRVVEDSAYIANSNMAFAFAHDMQNEQFGQEIVLEDGYVTEVHTRHKRIIGGNDMVVTTGEIREMRDKLASVSDAFCNLSMGCNDSNFALKEYYDKAANAFRNASLKVEECLRYCPRERNIGEMER